MSTFCQPHLKKEKEEEQKEWSLSIQTEHHEDL